MATLIENAPASMRLPVEWGVASRAIPGQSVSGDAYVVQPFSGGVLLAAVDGLGHGAEATAAASLAVGVLREHAEESPIALVGRCHESLRSTRGVVMSLASFHEADATLTWLGVGNVEGTLLRARPGFSPPREDFLLRPGVVGFQISPLRAVVVPVLTGDLLIFATDGIDSRFKEDAKNSLAPQACADAILARYVKPNDDALVLAVRFPMVSREHDFE